MKTLKIKSIFSTILCVIWISGLSAQSLTVTGTVTDEMISHLSEQMFR